jgi:predicted double-glycine peptidase
MKNVVKDFCQYYETFNLESVNDLSDIYSQNVIFEDPIHKIEGLQNLQRYFAKTLTNVTNCQFNIEDVVEQDGQAFVTWVMHYTHPKLNNGLAITLPGTSQLKFDETIFYQRDYYDLGQMIYQQLPLLNWIIKKIKKRMAQ